MNFLIISHGPMAQASLESAEMILGKQENVKTLSVTHDTTLEGMVCEIESVYDEFNQKELFIFCDIIGGTPSNASLRFMSNHKNVTAVTGFNLPVLIEAFMGGNTSKEALLAIIHNTYQMGMTEIKIMTEQESMQGVYLEEIEL